MGHEEDARTLSCLGSEIWMIDVPRGEVWDEVERRFNAVSVNGNSRTESTEPASTYSLTSGDFNFRPVLACFTPLFPQLERLPHSKRTSRPTGLHPTSPATSVDVIPALDVRTRSRCTCFNLWRYDDLTIRSFLIAMWIEEQTNKATSEENLCISKHEKSLFPRLSGIICG